MNDLGNKTIFSKNLQYYMNLHHINRYDLCAALGFKYSTVSEWISAKKYPRIDKIEMMARYFNIKKSDLIEKKSPITTIADRIKTFRIHNNMTQKELAEKLGVSYQQISQYENGKRNPKYETLIKIATVLNVDPEQLLSKDTQKEDSRTTADSPFIHITEKEKQLITAYRNQPQMQTAVNRLLNLEIS